MLISGAWLIRSLGPICLLAVLLAGCGRAPKVEPVASANSDSQPPALPTAPKLNPETARDDPDVATVNLEVMSVDQLRERLAALKGHYVIVDLWAMW